MAQIFHPSTNTISRVTIFGGVILLVVLLFFGSKRIPELAKGLGKGMREFKDAMSGIEREVHEAANSEPKKQPEEPKKLDQ